ncbi:metal ABC transporter permease [Sporomusa acidovorans]|uniref:High-affinity zinc uptake system membrane protein ZnuB n=1 Tax=Sporomusa acidovorans (strain ATCC 49682 / DSM 3132 / Mol) TaxID=1123286 RepID=A0ABZ3J1W2_SPOA4|nr:metal ABC transporter permease [Sporomusa acidovorans]OZC24093.1 high-affinity zinc uptake system membrane protein ZnuB [Sporomusa acidovorans DSM 3132]SDF68798.1 zinc transport system permease protein [Sporomusa acidovorans]
MLEGWYALVDFVLPFQWIGHNFMKNAFLAVLLVTPLFGILGTMVVSNRMAFFSDSLGHGAFTGIAIGALLGGIKPLTAIIVFSVIFASIITIIKHRSGASTDTIIGVFSSTAIAVGLIIMSQGGSFTKYSSYLIGDLLSITPTEIGMILMVFIGILFLWLVIFNKILLISINPSLAASRGINTLTNEILFSSALAVVVAISIQWVGLLIINSMLVLPAAAARNITTNIRQYHLVSVSLSLFSGVTGLISSYYWNTATGATIVLIAAVLFFITFSIRHRLTL